jgi:hypothetical protein
VFCSSLCDGLVLLCGKVIDTYWLMTIKEYLAEKEMTYAALAALCGCSAPRLVQIAVDGKRPSWELTLRIEKATKGWVGRENWYPPRS